MWTFLSHILYEPNLPWHRFHAILPRQGIDGTRIEGHIMRRRVAHEWQYRPETPQERDDRHETEVN